MTLERVRTICSVVNVILSATTLTVSLAGLLTLLHYHGVL